MPLALCISAIEVIWPMKIGYGKKIYLQSFQIQYFASTVVIQAQAAYATILTRAQAILALIKLLFKALIPLGQFHACSLYY